MAYTPTPRAFKFKIGTKEYALDIQTDGIVYFEPTVYLFWLAPDGWNMHYQQMRPQIKVNDDTVAAAGGIEAFSEIIVTAVNKALTELHGQPELPEGTTVQERILDYLAANLAVSGIQLVRK